MRIRYTGTEATHQPGLGDWAPGQERDVADDVAEAYTRRADFEEVESEHLRRDVPRQKTKELKSAAN